MAFTGLFCVRFLIKLGQVCRKVVQGLSDIGPVAVRVGVGQLPVGSDGLFGDGYSVGRAAEREETVAEPGEAGHEAETVAVGVGLGKLSVNSDGLFGDGQSVGGAAHLEETGAQVGQRSGEARAIKVRGDSGKFPVVVDRLLSGGEGISVAAKLGQGRSDGG